MDVRALAMDAEVHEDIGAPRVLVENEDHALLWATERALVRAGYSVIGCPGPHADKKELPSGACPVVEGRSCPLVDEADVVIFGLDLRLEAPRKILSILRDRGSRTAVVLDGSTGTSHPDDPITVGCDRISSYASTSQLIATVERALHRPG